MVITRGNIQAYPEYFFKCSNDQWMHGLYQEMVESVPDETTGNPSVPNLETLNNRRTLLIIFRTTVILKFRR